MDRVLALSMTRIVRSVVSDTDAVVDSFLQEDSSGDPAKDVELGDDHAELTACPCHHLDGHEGVDTVVDHGLTEINGVGVDTQQVTKLVLHL